MSQNPNQLSPAAFEQRVLNETSKATYSYAVAAFTPVATASVVVALLQPPASFLTSPSTAKILSLSNVRVSGIATATAEIDVFLEKVPTSGALTGGTFSTPTAAVHDSADPAPVGVIQQYSANPATFSGGVNLRSRHLQVAAAGTQAAPIDEIVWAFGGSAAKLPKLRASGEAYVINLNGAAIPAGLALTISVEWTEE